MREEGLTFLSIAMGLMLYDEGRQKYKTKYVEIWQMCIDYGCMRQPFLESEFLQSYFLYKSAAKIKTYKDFAMKNGTRIDKDFFGEYDRLPQIQEFYRSLQEAGRRDIGEDAEEGAGAGAGAGGGAGRGGGVGEGGSGAVGASKEIRRIGGYIARLPQRGDEPDSNEE